MSINEILPDEILQKIFSYICVRDRMLFIERVCSKWTKILNYVDVKELDLFDLHDEICQLDFECPFRKTSNRPSDYPLPEIWLMKFISRILPRFGCSLKSLSFQLQRNPNIRHISIGIDMMEFVLRICPNLVELNFLRCQLNATTVSMLPLFGHLKSLKLLRQDICDEIWPSLINDNKLRKLETESYFGQNFLSHNANNNSLETLRVNAIYSSDTSYSVDFPLHQLVLLYPNLIELDIRNLNLPGTVLDDISELRHLRILAVAITIKTDVRFLLHVYAKCHKLEDLTIMDYQSNGSISLPGVTNGSGIKLKNLNFNSMKIVTAGQLKAIKKMNSLRTLMLRTNKLPPIEESEDRSECISLEELTISSTNREETSYQYKIFLNVCTKLKKIGYLPRGWSLHNNDGVEPNILSEYLSRTCSENDLIKLLLYARDTDDLSSLLQLEFRELTGLIVFGSCSLTDETTQYICRNFPRLSYILTEHQIEISSNGIVNLLKCPQLTDLHAKWKDLEVDEKICYAIGYSSSLKQIGFRGVLMINKVRLFKKEWDKIMEGRIDLFREGRTCHRVFVDCWYLNSWSKKLAEAFRTLWISCKAAKHIEQEISPNQVLPIMSMQNT